MLHGEFSDFTWLYSEELRQKSLQFTESTYKKLKQLTPAGRRLLALMLTSYNVNSGSPLNRKQIASLLDRPKGLTPHDRNLLDTLCDCELIEARRCTLWTQDRRARGAELIYTMDHNTGWALNRIRRQSRKRRSTA